MMQMPIQNKAKREQLVEGVVRVSLITYRSDLFKSGASSKRFIFLILCLNISRSNS